MFLDFLNKWLKWRYTKQTQEIRSFHRDEAPEIPEGYYAVISVELKPISLEAMLLAEPEQIHA